MSYEQLDKIADSYIPVLLVLFLLGLGRNVYLLWPSYRAAFFSFLYLIGLLVISYGLMFFDSAVRLWPTFGLDYSTHTAVALSLVFALCTVFARQWKWIAGSMGAYAGLMLYQQYHSVMDILTTSLVIGAFAALLYKIVGRPNPDVGTYGKFFRFNHWN